MVDRSGRVLHVVVGTKNQIVIPYLGRTRLASYRLSGVRVIHTHFLGQKINHDDLVDLAYLKLDVMCAVVRDKKSGRINFQIAYLKPKRDIEEPWVIEEKKDLDIDFLSFVRDLEEEFKREMDSIHRKSDKERAIGVFIFDIKDLNYRSRIEELKQLAHTSEVEIVDHVLQFRKRPDPAYLIGRGKLEEVIIKAMYHYCDLIIFDRDLSPAQLKNITEQAEIRVIDRTQLILDIFARHAKSRAGKIQVELAQLKYTLPRLVQSKTAFSRLAGGIGTRGPGEQKLEIDRRRIRDRIIRLEKELKTIERMRKNRRKLRNKRDIPIIPIVGYTNAGKSTLLNRLTNADEYSANKLFATLDPKTRRLRFPNERDVIITDTVGFIQDLPEELLKAFKATIEEIGDGDMILHIVDASNPDMDRHIEVVTDTLKDLGLWSIPQLLVFNKVDKIDEEKATNLSTMYNAICVSAKTGYGLVELVERMAEMLEQIEDMKQIDTDAFESWAEY